MGFRDFVEIDPDVPAPVVGERRVLVLSLLGLALLLAWQAFAVRSYADLQSRPPSAEDSRHMALAWDYWRAGQDPAASERAPLPPLYHMAISRAYASPRPAAEAVRLNWLYLALLCVAVFGIAYHFKPDASALIAVCLLFGAPALRTLTISQRPDLAVAAWVAAAYWCFFLSWNFRRAAPALAYGACAGLAFMHHPRAALFLVAPAMALLGALLQSGRRLAAASALLAAGAISLPWYARHAGPFLAAFIFGGPLAALPRSLSALFLPFLDLMALSHPVLFVAALGGLASPLFKRHQDQSVFLVLWFLASFAFWSFLPGGRPLDLAAAIAPLAVAAACGAWPKPFLWAAAAVMVFIGANFTGGWIGKIALPFPGHPIALFPSDPPSPGDWQIDAIIKEASARRAGAPSQLTVAAADPYFSAANFDWAARVSGEKGLLVRGAGARLCDFSRFVAVKTGGARLPAWFERAYQRVKSWPLPGGGEAALFEERPLAAPPFKDSAPFFAYYTTRGFSATDLKVALADWERADSSYLRATAAAAEMTVAGLRVTGVRLSASGLALIPAGENEYAPWDDVRFLKASRVAVDALGISARDLQKFLESHVSGLSISRLDLDGDVSVSGLLKNVAFSAKFSLALLDGPPRLALAVKEARLGASLLPAWLLGGAGSAVLPLDAGSAFPFPVALRGLSVRGGRITVP